MKSIRRIGGPILTACYLLLAFATNSLGTDFYVSSIQAGRSDANAGTSLTAPWATFDKVKSAWGTTIKAGDTVHLERGSTWYWSWGSSAPYWNLSTGGSVGKPITIRGDDYGLSGAKPVLQRNGGTGWGSMIGIGGTANYVTLRDFTIDGGMAAGFGTTAISIGGGYLKTTAISNISVLNMTIQNLGNTTAAYCCGIEVAGYNDLAVNDCLIENNDVSNYTGHGLNHYPQKTTYRTTSANNRIVWRNNRIWGASPNVWAGCGAGIHIAFGGSGNIFEHNYILGGNPAGSFMIMNCNNDEVGLKVRYNVIKGNTLSNGIIFLYDPKGVAGTTVSCDIYDNIIMQSRYAGISFEANNAFSGTVNVYNNTFYDNRLAAGSTGQGGEILVASANDGLNLNIKNNLFYHKAYSGNTTPGLCVVSGYSATLAHQNNLYWHTGGTGSPAVYDRGTTYSVATVKTYEPSAQNTDPLFTDMTQLPAAVSSALGVSPSGLTVRSGSPAINTGTALAAEFARDVNGIARPQGASWDVGSYEYLSGPVELAPSAPSDLTATANSSNQITLAWKDNSANETSFKVQRSPDGITFSALASVSSNVAGYVNTGLNAKTTYYYRVCASNSAGSSAFSAIASAVTPGPTLPLAPASLSAIANSSNQITLAWQDNSTNETNFKIERSLDGVAFSALSTVGSNVTSYVNAGLSAKTTYYYRVCASNSAGSSAFSAIASAVTPGPTLPLAPSGLAASTNTPGSAVLTWVDNATNETGFILERSSDGTNFTVFAALGANVTTVADNNVEVGFSYTYRVRASNEVGNSLFSNTVTVKIAGTRSARNYYLSSVETGRSDSNSGTNPALPWATFDKMKSSWGTVILPGDTVHLGARSVWTWTGDTAWTVTQGGNAVAGPVVIRGDDYGSGEYPVLRKSGGTNTLGAITITGSASYLVLRDFVIEGNPGLGVNTTGIRIGGADHAGLIHHITVSGMKLQNLADGTNVLGAGIELLSRNGYIISDCLIESNEVSGFSAFGLSHFPEKNVARSGSLINRVVYRGNRVFDPSPNRFAASNSGMKFRSGGASNVVEYNSFAGPYMEGLMSLINCANDESNLTVRFNLLSSNTEGPGFWIGYDGGGATGILYKADLVGNIILGCQKPGLSLDTHNYYRGAFNVFNNTFYGNELRPGTADSGAEVLVQAMNAGTTLTLANNIMAHLAVTGSQSSSLSVQIGFAGSFAHHHNLFWNSAGSAATLVYNMGALHTAGTIASYESTGLASEPLFINTNDLPTTVSRESGGSPEGLGLTLSSPAINKGADLGPLYAQDIEGLARPQGAAWDMGAYETVISPGPPTNVHVIP